MLGWGRAETSVYKRLRLTEQIILNRVKNNIALGGGGRVTDWVQEKKRNRGQISDLRILMKKSKEHQQLWYMCIQIAQKNSTQFHRNNCGRAYVMLDMGCVIIDDSHIPNRE